MRSTRLPSWIERILGIDPVPAPPHVFTLDGDPVQLRYGSFHRGAQGYVFEESRAQELLPDTLGEGPMGAPLQEPKVFADDVLRLVNSIEANLTEATLVLPDEWLRLIFIELQELPKKSNDRLDVLRLNLKPLVPIRIEDLRLSATVVDPFPGQEGAVRMLVGFALDRLLDQIEDAFAEAGVVIGRVTNTSLALLESLKHNLDSDDMAVLLTVLPRAYTVTYMLDGQPVLYRYKPLGEAERFDRTGVNRDLRLTANFMAQHFPDRPPRRFFLAAGADVEAQWLEWTHDLLDIAPEPLSFDHFLLTRTQVGPTWIETAPLLGAASLEV